MNDSPHEPTESTTDILRKLCLSITEQRGVQFSAAEARMILHLIIHHTAMLKSTLSSLESAAGSLDSLKDKISDMTQSIETPLQSITKGNRPPSSERNFLLRDDPEPAG